MSGVFVDKECKRDMDCVDMRGFNSIKVQGLVYVL